MTVKVSEQKQELIEIQRENYRREESWKLDFANDYIESMKRVFAPFQKGVANKDNFFWRTYAIFKERKTRPRRKPDYVRYDRYGKISSEYWYTDKGVIRGSNHWGCYIASCNWVYEGLKSSTSGCKETYKIYGFAKWEDFVQDPIFMDTEDGEFIVTNFENTIGKEKVEIDGTVYIKMDGYHHTYWMEPKGCLAWM